MLIETEKMSLSYYCTSSIYKKSWLKMNALDFFLLSIIIVCKERINKTVLYDTGNWIQ